jgi:hypothetical protein
MNEILKVLVVVVFAIPFIYMFYDITVDLSKKAYKAVTQKAKPAVATILSSIFN